MDLNILKKEINKAPHLPGIYLFKNAHKKPLYIGKALDLNKRLKSYPRTDDIRIQKMITESASLSFIETDSEIEALIIESQYIKKYMPDFNIMQRDDKQYGYVSFSKDIYPKIFITHQIIKIRNSNIEILNKSKIQNKNIKTISDFGFRASDLNYIGPFTDMGALKTTLRLLRRIFPYCTCKQLHNNYCLNYHINKCIGDCCLKIKNVKIKNQNDNTKLKNYRKNIIAIQSILSGKRSSLIKNLEKEMKTLSDKQEYEKAMELQFKIEKLKKVFENAQIIENLRFKNEESSDQQNKSTLSSIQKLLKLNQIPIKIEGYDISNMQGTNATGSMVSFINGKPDKNTYRKFKIYTKDTPNDIAMIQEIVERRFKHTEWQYPDLILIDGGKGQLNAVLKVFKKMNINIPVIGISKDEHHKGHQLLILKSAGWKIISLNKLSQSDKNLLLKIDEEAHRFAISYYRKIQRKKAFRPNY